MPSSWKDLVFDNAHQVDAQEAEAKIRSKYPNLLHADERLEVAFTDRGGKGRDKEFFTSHRILIKDGKGVGNKRKNYVSVPYDTILAFSVQSSGAALVDGDTELRVWSLAYPKLTIDFSKAHVDIFQIYQFLNAKVTFGTTRGAQDKIDAIPPNMDKKQSKAGDLMDWLGDNAKQIDAKEVERIFKEDYPILLGDETVEIAFRSGRDTTFFSSKRILIIDVKGLGKKIEFKTILYSTIHGFSVQTAGVLDRDTEMTLYTNLIGDMYKIEQDFRNGKANLFAVQKVLANHVLGDDKEPLPDIDRLEGHQDTEGGIFGVLTGLRFDQRPMDAVVMDKILHADPPILQGMERVEMAFRGHRDVTLFTTKRCVIIDTKGLVGKRIEYFSLPWEKIVAFGIRSAGALIDFDTEVQLYTEMGFYPGEPGRAGTDNSPPVPPIPARPEQSCL